MAIFVGASGQVGVGDPYQSDDLGRAYAPGKPAFWSLLILVALIAAVVVIAKGAS